MLFVFSHAARKRFNHLSKKCSRDSWQSVCFVFIYFKCISQITTHLKKKNRRHCKNTNMVKMLWVSHLINKKAPVCNRAANWRLLSLLINLTIIFTINCVAYKKLWKKIVTMLKITISQSQMWQKDFHLLSFLRFKKLNQQIFDF